MKTAISIMLVLVGLGVDPNGSENADIALGLCFFFGAINLVMPAVSALNAASGFAFRKKVTAGKRNNG